MNKENQLKQNTAITLIALVITIIVLLILSAVTLNMVLGENGLIAKAKQAKDNYKSAETEELGKLDILNNEVDTIINNGRAGENQSLASQTPGTATAGDILSGKTAWVNGQEITGTLSFGDFVNNYGKIANGSFEYDNSEGTENYIYEVSDIGFQPNFVYCVLEDSSGSKIERYYDSNKSTTKCYGHYFSGSNYEQTFSNSMDNGVYQITNTGFKFIFNPGCYFKVSYIAIQF